MKFTTTGFVIFCVVSYAAATYCPWCDKTGCTKCPKFFEEKCGSKRVSCYRSSNSSDECTCKCVDEPDTPQCFAPTEVPAYVKGGNVKKCRVDDATCSEDGVNYNYRICTWTNVMPGYKVYSNTDNCCNCRCDDSLTCVQDKECKYDCGEGMRMACLTDRYGFNNTVSCQCIKEEKTKSYKDQDGLCASYCPSLNCAGNKCYRTKVCYDVIDVCTDTVSCNCECLTEKKIQRELRDKCDSALISCEGQTCKDIGGTCKPLETGPPTSPRSHFLTCYHSCPASA